MLEVGGCPICTSVCQIFGYWRLANMFWRCQARGCPVADAAVALRTRLLDVLRVRFAHMTRRFVERIRDRDMITDGGSAGDDGDIIPFLFYSVIFHK